MNIYQLDRFEGNCAILIHQDEHQNELSILRDRLIAIAKPGDLLMIEFDSIGNLKTVEIILPEEPCKKKAGT